MDFLDFIFSTLIKSTLLYPLGFDSDVRLIIPNPQILLFDCDITTLRKTSGMRDGREERTQTGRPREDSDVDNHILGGLS